MAISAKDLTAKDAVAFIKKRPIPIVCGLASLLLLVGAYYRSSTLAEMETQQKQKEDEGKQILENVSNGTNLPEQLDTLVAATKGAIALAPADAALNGVKTLEIK